MFRSVFHKLFTKKRNKSKPFFKREQQILKNRLLKFGCYVNINFDVYVTTTFKCSQINLRKNYSVWGS